MAEEDAVTEMVCSNPECRVAETRRCVEGLALDACPHFGREAEEDDQVESSAEETAAGGVPLPAAAMLTVAGAAEVLRQESSRVIAILGPSDSGKTSLIAGLYDCFQEGAVDGVEFSRSRTLHAFEQTCHDARAVSRRGVPHVSRTPRGEVSFYHLEISGGPSGSRLALLLGDRAGEEYREVGDDITVVDRFAEVTRADTLTVLVDGERLLGGGRHNLRSSIMMMLQGLRDGGALRPCGRLALVLTKLDAVQASENAERAFDDFGRLLQDVQRLFGDMLSVIQPFQIAASPKVASTPRGTGLAALLQFWLGQIDMVPAEPIEPTRHGRAFARLCPVADLAEAADD